MGRPAPTSLGCCSAARAALGGRYRFRRASGQSGRLPWRLVEQRSSCVARRPRTAVSVSCGSQLELVADCRFNRIVSKDPASTGAGACSSSARSRTRRYAGEMPVAPSKRERRGSRARAAESPQLRERYGIGVHQPVVARGESHKRRQLARLQDRGTDRARDTVATRARPMSAEIVAALVRTHEPTPTPTRCRSLSTSQTGHSSAILAPRAAEGRDRLDGDGPCGMTIDGLLIDANPRLGIIGAGLRTVRHAKALDRTTLTGPCISRRRV
jgi:hypothetical protein